MIPTSASQAAARQSQSEFGPYAGVGCASFKRFARTRTGYDFALLFLGGQPVDVVGEIGQGVFDLAVAFGISLLLSFRRSMRPSACDG